MSGLLIIEDSISRWSSLFPSDCSPQNKVSLDSFNVNKAIHISLAAQPWHQQWLGFTNIKHSCRVIALHFTLSWTVHHAQACLFITNCTFTMETQSILDWNIHEVERAHSKDPETAFEWARTFNDACLVFLHQVLVVFSANISQAPQQERWMRGNRVTAQRIVLMEISFLPRYSTWFWFPPLQINDAIFSCNEHRVEALYADFLPWHVNCSLPKYTGAKVQSLKCIWLLLKTQNTQLWIWEVNRI